MLRLVGVTAIAALCIATAPWGLVVGAIVLAGWLLLQPASSSTDRSWSGDEPLGATAAGRRLLSAIPLLNAVYCVNCDLITNSPHDACGVCGSHSVIAVSRMWQLTFADAPAKSARYRVSLTADVSAIPVEGLHESAKLISRIAELGGDVNTLHIQVEPVAGSDASRRETRLDVIRPPRRPATAVRQNLRRRAS